ncbi:GNAT family N-acetyltransferase [Aurantivibrio plasticivorans]
MIELTGYRLAQKSEVISLYLNVFSDSEGESEGRLIGLLVEEMIAKTPAEDLIGFIAQSGRATVGCIFFSRVWVPSGQEAFILSPVAVQTQSQRQGIGQQLIRYGLDDLKRRAVDLVFTYGDPHYYGKFGFKQLSESVMQAPCKLSQPEGWMVQSLKGEAIKRMQGRVSCIKPLNDPTYW